MPNLTKLNNNDVLIKLNFLQGVLVHALFKPEKASAE